MTATTTTATTTNMTATVTARRLGAVLWTLEMLLGNGGMPEDQLTGRELRICRHLRELGLTERTMKAGALPALWGATHAGRDLLAQAQRTAAW